MAGPRVGDPDYIRRVRHGYQARPMHHGERVNLGVYPTEHDARRAVNLLRAGKLTPLPKFVRRTPDDDPPRYFWHIRLDGVNIRSHVLHRTPEAADRACRAFLLKLDGLMGMVGASRVDGRRTSSRL